MTRLIVGSDGWVLPCLASSTQKESHSCPPPLSLELVALWGAPHVGLGFRSDLTGTSLSSSWT